MKNINWKKYVGSALAATMIIILATPITTGATEFYGLAPGYNIKMTLDGKPANNLFNEKSIRLVSTENPDQYYSVYNRYGKDMFWVPAGQTYEIYDITDSGNSADAHKGLKSKGQIWVDAEGNTTIPTINYTSETESNLQVETSQSVPAATNQSISTGVSHAIPVNSDVSTQSGTGMNEFINDLAERLLIEGQTTKVTKVISPNEKAEIKYNLTDKNVSHFKAVVSLDEKADVESAKVSVFVDGELRDSLIIQNKPDNKVDLNVDLNNAETLEFIIEVENSTANTNGNTTTIFDNAKLYQQ